MTQAAHPPLAAKPMAWAMLAVMALELAARSFGAAWPVLDWAAWLAMGAVVLIAAPRFGLREIYLVGLCVILTALVLWRAPAPLQVLHAALDQGGFLMAFILFLSLLYEAAASSPAVAELGRTLTRQPPGRRYYALFVGTGALSVLFNLGVTSFLVPLIQRGIVSARPNDPLNPVRERRQVSAMLRGFAWAVIWSPTAMAPLALIELIDGVDRHRWMLAGMVMFCAIMALGAAEDWLRHRHLRGQSRAIAPLPFPTSAALRFLAACGWLLALSLGFAWLSGDTIVFGLLVGCWPMVVGWLYVQARGGGAQLGARLRQITGASLPQSANIAVALGASGFVGRAGASLLPAQALADSLGLAQMPDWMLLTLLPITIACLSLLALSPIIMAVFFGSLFGALPVMPADPTLLALSISCGWALSMTFSPFATVVLMISRVGNIPALRLTWGWNLVFSLMVVPFLALSFGMLTGWR